MTATIAAMFVAFNSIFVALAIVPATEVAYAGFAVAALALLEAPIFSRKYFLGAFALALACLTRYEAWPVADALAARADQVELAVQVNGKVRGRITVACDASEEAIRKEALEEPHVKTHLDGKQIAKLVVVPGRLVSVVVR